MKSKDVVGKRIVRVLQGNYQKGVNGMSSGCALYGLVFEDGTSLDLQAHEAENTGPWVEGKVSGVAVQRTATDRALARFSNRATELSRDARALSPDHEVDRAWGLGEAKGIRWAAKTLRGMLRGSR
jgi:hypothetical protein